MLFGMLISSVNVIGRLFLFYSDMKTKENIISIIEEKLGDIEYANTQTRMSDEYYMKNDAKIQVLEEILRLIAD